MLGASKSADLVPKTKSGGVEGGGEEDRRREFVPDRDRFDPEPRDNPVKMTPALPAPTIV